MRGSFYDKHKQYWTDIFWKMPSKDFADHGDTPMATTSSGSPFVQQRKKRTLAPDHNNVTTAHVSPVHVHANSMRTVLRILVTIL
eukprot:CAMPEP_0116826832 /NCGR_PEP_ID=MMETSP0418-20121206/2747_1 /TAXON_ID=1158023 /ORGANISM="Astrosyne radiata, Strain 13vi08-1A" /LENGTH=84 /DNA_ID=CAMNT_0004455509 /DNA_START=1936 /DNA_END=2190 /DNA_ORIENTATION=+